MTNKIIHKQVANIILHTRDKTFDAVAQVSETAYCM